MILESISHALPNNYLWWLKALQQPTTQDPTVQCCFYRQVSEASFLSNKIILTAQCTNPATSLAVVAAQAKVLASR